MPRMTAMDAAVRILRDEGVEHLFGIPGAGILPFYRAMKDLGGFKHYIARHEESAIHMADGYARATNGVGVCVATSGPGATNFVTGLYTAQVDSIPVLAITGQNVRAQLGREAFQAVDIAGIVRPITKKSYCVQEPGLVPGVFREAFKVMKEGRPGPVLVDLPLDVQKGEVIYNPEADCSLPIVNPQPSGQQVSRALDMLLEAAKPVMLLGGGVLLSGAAQDFVALAEKLQIPVVTTYMGKSGIPHDHPLAAGSVGIQCSTRSGNQLFIDSDTVLAVGVRFNDRHTGDIETYTKGRSFIHVDIDPGQIGKNFLPALGICSDAGAFLRAMLKEADSRDLGQRRARVNVPELRESLAREADFNDVPIKPQRVFKEVNEFFGEDTIFVTCIGQNQIWSGQFQQISKPLHYLDCGGAGPLGWDLPASIGTKVARPDKQVAMITGDFGFQFCMDSLPVAVQYKVPFVCIVLNNGYLGLIRQGEYNYDMEYEVDIRYDSLQPAGAGREPAMAGADGAQLDPDFAHPAENDGRGFDFVKFAEAAGCGGERVFQPDQIQPALQRAVDSGIPYVVEIVIEPKADAAMGKSIDAVKEFD